MKLEHPNRKWWETALLIVVLIAVIAYGVQSVFWAKRLQKERELRYQLALLRQGVNIFYIIENRYPVHMIELATKTYRFPDEDQNFHYVERLVLDENGWVVDSFGKPFAYFPERGQVMSSTYGYTSW